MMWAACIRRIVDGTYRQYKVGMNRTLMVVFGGAREAILCERVNGNKVISLDLGVSSRRFSPSYSPSYKQFERTHCKQRNTRRGRGRPIKIGELAEAFRRFTATFSPSTHQHWFDFGF